MGNTITINPKVRLKPIALPVEHGSWGFLLEPLVAAVVVAPSASAPWIFLMAAAAFLARQPLKIYLGDVRAHRKLPQTDYAFKFSMVFLTIAAAGFTGTLLTAPPIAFAPLALAAPFAGFQIYRDVLRKSRGLWSEILGAIAVSSTSASVALAAGWELRNALLLWTIFAARLIPSIVYVRARLALEKGKPFSAFAVVGSNAGAFVLVAALAWFALIPALPAGVFAVLMCRAIWGISPYRRKVKAMRIGIWEVVYGALVALSVIGGYLYNVWNAR